MKAFISYQTEDKQTAGQLKSILEGIGIPSFMAHEDIHVSEEWRLKILEEIGFSEIFISIWSKDYNISYWCIQESGIASFRKDMTVIPLSIDGSVPQGFAGNVQSTKINPEKVYLADLLPGLVKANFNFGIKLIIDIIGGSRSYRGAESNFKYILPYVEKLSETQGKKLLEVSIKNGQVIGASECATLFLPPLEKRFSHLLSSELQKELSKALGFYNKS